VSVVSIAGTEGKSDNVALVDLLMSFAATWLGLECANDKVVVFIAGWS
jgi:hypothetical protein